MKIPQGAAVTPASTGNLRVIHRRGLPLRWRVTLLSSLAIAFLSVIAALTAFWAVRSSLRGDLQRSLRRDAQKVAALYSQGGQGQAGVSLSGPTGGVIVQFYDPRGRLFVASNSSFEVSEAAIPSEVVKGAEASLRDWRGELIGRSVQAALAPFSLGVVAVVADTAPISNALTQLARTMLFTALLLVVLSALIGYLVGAAAIHPIAQLAQRAATLGPNHLHPIPYQGPSDEVGQLSHVLNELIMRLKTAIDAQRSFLAETSHELRTPLTSLHGFLDRAIRRSDAEVQRDLLDARRIARTMSRLVEDLLQLSRGELVTEMVPHLVDPCLDILRPIAEEFPGVHLTGRPGELLLGDPERLRQLVRNLTANAVRATGDPKEIELALERTAERIILVVRDQGPGIPDDVLPRIFDKFYKGAGGGAGLGLAIAKQITDMHHGEITVASKPGCTTFRVSLPAVEAGDG